MGNREEMFRNAVHDFSKPAPGRDADVVMCWPPSLARKEFAEDCDINAIMARYEVTGQLPMGSAMPQYLDLTAVPSTLMETLSVLKEAEAAFMRLPATVRREFDNDPVAFAEFAMNPDNLSQMRDWGLAQPEDVTQGLVPEPAPVPPAPATPSASPAPSKSA